MLLDESHLELVEDVLKEINFNDEDWRLDWRQLGRELGVHVQSLKYSYSENSLILKECLREWLSPSTSSHYWQRILDDEPGPSLYDLAAALKSIGYSEAGEYIIKTCKLIMFNDQCY